MTGPPITTEPADLVGSRWRRIGRRGDKGMPHFTVTGLCDTFVDGDGAPLLEIVIGARRIRGLRSLAWVQANYRRIPEATSDDR